MSESQLARVAGPLTLAAGALFAITQLVLLARIARVDPQDPQWLQALLSDPVYLAGGIVYFGAFCLLVLALVATYMHLGHGASTFWTIGVVAAIVGTMNLAGNFWFEAFASPWIGDVAPEALTAGPSGLLVIGGLSSYTLFTLGWVLFGLAGLRTRAFPAYIALAIVAGGVVGFNASPPYGVLLGLAVAWLGAWMLRSPASRSVSSPATP